MTTTTKTPTAPATNEQRQADAEAEVAAADLAAEQARAAVDAARQAVTDAETEAVAVLAAGSARSRIEQARQKLASAKDDAELAELAAHAADVRYSRAADQAAAVHRAIVADEYRQAVAHHDDPNNHESQLAGRIAADVADLCRLVTARQAEHDRLAREYASFPAAERFPIPGRPLQTYGHRGLGVWSVDVPCAEAAEAIKAGITAAESAGY